MEKKLCSYEALFTVVATLPEDELRAVVDDACAKRCTEQDRA